MQHHNNDTLEFCADVFSAVDSSDEAQIIHFLTDDCSFVFANEPPLVGHRAISAGIRNFTDLIKGMKHDLIESWRCDDTIISRMTVTYTRHNNTSLTVPAVTIWKMNKDLIARYLIYVDKSGLFQS